MAAPDKFVQHLATLQYHPRSSKHGQALCDFVLDDLLANCPKLAHDSVSRRLVYERNRKITVGHTDWNIDLVLGPPPAGFQAPSTSEPIIRAMPATVRIAIEAKTIMTEHGKARRNRQRDLESFQQFTRRYDSNTISAAVTIVNVASEFKSPLRVALAIHRNVAALAQSTVSVLRSIPLRSTPDQHGLDANTVIVVQHDNVDPAKTALVLASPAPQTGDPLHYDSFLHRICDRYTQRVVLRPSEAGLVQWKRPTAPSECQRASQGRFFWPAIRERQSAFNQWSA